MENKDIINPEIIVLLEGDVQNNNDNREKLALLIASGKCKEMIGINLSQEGLKKMERKDVDKYMKRYEASVSGKSCDVIADTFIDLSVRMIGYVLPVDKDKLKDDLNSNYFVKQNLSQMAARLSLDYSEYMSAVSFVMLTLKNINLDELFLSSDNKKEVEEDQVKNI